MARGGFTLENRGLTDLVDGVVMADGSARVVAPDETALGSLRWSCRAIDGETTIFAIERKCQRFQEPIFATVHLTACQSYGIVLLNPINAINVPLTIDCV